MAISKIGSKAIVDCSVATADLEDGSVSNAKLANSSITINGTSVSLGASASLKDISWQSVITADGSTATSAVAGNGYFIDTTSAAHTITLPSSPSIGDKIAIKDYAGTFGTNNLTIGRNSENIQGVASDSLISTNRASLILVYSDATRGWLYTVESNVNFLGPTYITATGGTITTSGDFKIHTFTGDGCFVVSQIGNPTGGPSNVDYLVVAGGGGGGSQDGGGGGAGGYRESHSTPISGCYTASPLATPTGITVSSTTYPITVGSGGAGSISPQPDATTAPSGSNSVFSTITSTGGGGGGNESCGPGGTGGSGGGSSGGGGGGPGGSGNTPPTSPPQGNNGGSTGPNSSPGYGGSGGGGAGANGTNANGSGNNGHGGAGVATSITTSPTYYSGGGGGNSRQAYNGDGGAGGGGSGAAGTANTPGCNGTANTGGGGGGGGHSTGSGGAGGKGIVVIRYKYQN